MALGRSEGPEGGHPPVVYPAAGRYLLLSAIFVENAQGGSGLGCDTTAPVRRVEPSRC